MQQLYQSRIYFLLKRRFLADGNIIIKAEYLNINATVHSGNIDSKKYAFGKVS